MPKVGLEPRIYCMLHKLKLRFMKCKDSQAREAFMIQSMELLENYLNAHEITTTFFLNALSEIEQWDWEAQLQEIRNLPEKVK